MGASGDASGNGDLSEPSSGSKSFFRKVKSVLGIKNSSSLKESLEEVIEEHDSSGEYIDPEEKEMLQKVLAFSELTVEDVMIPRADIIAVEYETPFDELKKFMVEKAHTRVPVYRKNMDDIAGFIHIKDIVKVLCNNEEFNMESMMRQTLFVPPSMKISTLLMKMQLAHVHMAIVIDEYGGTTGLVTMEDLVEEIVGEIEDEHDIVDVVVFNKIGSNSYEASARMPIDDLQERLGVDLVEEGEGEDFDTLGGLIFFILGRIPAKGEVALHPKGLEFEILDADPRHIKRVLIRNKGLPSPSEGEGI